jgi:hypothetical protein
VDEAEARVARRLAPRYSSQAWLAICVKAVPARQHDDGSAIVRTPDHYLAAAWAPSEQAPSRWPEAVVIGSPTPTRALDELLQRLPAGAMLHLAGLDDVDAALAAEILLHGDRNLEPYQREAIAAFIAAEQARTRSAIGARYTDRDAGYERFRARVAK